MPAATRIAVICGTLLFSAANASGQLIMWEDRAFLNASVGLRPGGTTDTPEITGSSARNRFVDVTAGIRTGSNFGFGLGVASSLSETRHREVLIAPLAFYMLPMTHRLDLIGIGGPSVARIRQGEVTGTQPGFHIGADARYLLTDRFALGALLRYNWLKSDLTDGVTADLAGWHIGSGLRVRF